MHKFILFFLIVFSPLQAIEYKTHQANPHTTAHVITVNPKQNPIKLVKATDPVTRRQTVSTLVKNNGAIAGINGGFWRQNGSIAGILKINNVLYGTSSKPRGAIGWSQNGAVVLMDRIITKMRNDKSYEVIPITQGNSWENLDYIVAGVPLLIKNGKLIDDYSPEMPPETFLRRKRPRTAVGIKKNGDWMLVVVDAPLFNPQGGMTVKELASFMLNLGSVNALNLDGGGSSVMIYNGGVINEPTGDQIENGKLVRAVTDAIVIMPITK